MQRVKKVLIIVAVFSIIGIFLIASGAGDKYYKGFQMFVKTVNIIKEVYVRDVPPEYLFSLAINGMLTELDPHSVMLEKKDLEDFNIHTRGEFGGIGIQIGLVDKVLTVITPIEGTPAYKLGILPGDKIIKIEGKSTKGYTLNKAVSVLRGKPGTKVKITILRNGKEIDYTITRDIIHIKDVPFAGIIDKDSGIGYVRLLEFSANAPDEVKSACDSLTRKGARYIILDLRGNPGGLLSSACDIADLFLPKDRLIVFTKGRNPVTQKSYYSRNPEKYKLPVIVLVDRGSASASEIVSGAIQDWDRGIIIGDTTYGKGSVQNLFKISDDASVKITVARYYTPSGRCIDRELKQYENNQLYYERDYLNMNVNPNDTTKEIYYTKGKFKRKVVGGGGIIPDILVKHDKITELEINLWKNNVIFNYVVHAKKKFSPKFPDYTITPEIEQDFINYMKKNKIEFTQKEYKKARKNILLRLQQEFAMNDRGNYGRYMVITHNDPVVLKAVNFINKYKTLDRMIKNSQR